MGGAMLLVVGVALVPENDFKIWALTALTETVGEVVF